MVASIMEQVIPRLRVAIPPAVTVRYFSEKLEKAPRFLYCLVPMHFFQHFNKFRALP